MSILCATKKVENSAISCRVCLERFDSYYELGAPMLQSMEGPTFEEAIQYVTNMDFFETTNDVYWICSLCAEELKTAYSFLQKFRNTEKLLLSKSVDVKSMFEDDNLELAITEEIEPLNIEHEEVIALELKDSTDDSFKLFIEEESSFSFDEDEEEVEEESPPFEALGLQLHCSPCNKTFESQESMNNHKTWHLTNDLNSSGGVVNEVVINPPSDCEDESKEEGKIEELILG